MGTIDFTPGAFVGRYQIVERIGEGGMAEVFLGKCGDQRVAIKRLLPLFAHDQRFIDMFVAEARLAATLHHPNIAKVHDVGVDHGACYFAMELVDGHDVRALIAAASIQGRPMPLTIALSIMYGTTCALAYVHDPRGPHARLNIVHRDISPSNILVSFGGAIKLVDFGIARVESSGAVTRSASGELKGKIPYMSPEQCRARPLDGRSDLFSLGVVLYELTTNTRPFDREGEFDTLEAIVSGQFARPSKVVRGYPADLEAIVLRLLATKPADRYPSANTLLLDLDGVIANHGVDLSNDVLADHIRALLAGKPPPPKKQRTSRLDTVPAITPVEPPRELAASARLPIDRVVLRCDEILRTVAPEVADARDLSADAVGVLIGRAMRAHAKGDLENAVLSIELALSAERTAEVETLIAQNEQLIMAVFGAFLGGQGRTIALSQHIEQLVGIEIDQRAAFLLTRIDGTLTAHELLRTCGLPPREACRHLCQLVLREVVVLVS